jgi:dephospho-CoA kinase
MPLRVIVGGGIGSGKSTVLRVFEDLGAAVIEADRIGREILEPGGGAYARVVATWPEVVVAGRIDRNRLAAIVFSDPEQLAELEAISHPLIAIAIAERVAELKDCDIVLELPLTDDLVGPGWFRVVVVAPRRVRLERAIARGMDGADVAGRMDAQADGRRWLEIADAIIDNGGSVADLQRQVRELWERLHKTGGTGSSA